MKLGPLKETRSTKKDFTLYEAVIERNLLKMRRQGVAVTVKRLVT